MLIVCEVLNTVLGETVCEVLNTVLSETVCEVLNTVLGETVHVKCLARGLSNRSPPSPFLSLNHSSTLFLRPL